MGVIQAKCCQSEGNRESDRKADAEEQAMVTLVCQDDTNDVHTRVDVSSVSASNLQDNEGQAEAAETQIKKPDSQTEVFDAHLEKPGSAIEADIAAVDVAQSAIQDTTQSNIESSLQQESSDAPRIPDITEQAVEKIEGRTMKEVDDNSTKPLETDTNVQGVEESKQLQELDVQKQPEKENKSSAKKSAAKKKATSKAKAKATPKAEDESLVKETELKEEATPRKKIPMNAKEREAAWQALSKEEQIAEADKLVKAIEEGDYNIIGRLMKEGVKADTRNEKGETALYVAAKNGNISLLEFLISNCGADINGTTKSKETALHAACRNDKKEAMEWLVTQGINRNAKNKKGETAANVARGETAKSEILTFKMSRQK